MKKTKRTYYKEKLKSKFQVLDESLLIGLTKIRQIIKEMELINIFHFEFKEATTINHFQKLHKVQLKELDMKLERYRAKIKQVIVNACQSSYIVYKNQKKITLEDETLAKKEEDDEDGKEKFVPKSFKKKSNEKENANFVQNFLKDNMPYAQDATRRTHYKKLLRFIRLIDFLFNEAKYNVIINSLSKLNEKFQRIFYNYTNNLPDFPIMTAIMHPMKDMIKFMPQNEAIKKAIFDEFIKEKIYSVIKRISFLDPNEFPAYWSCYDEVFEVTIDQSNNLNIRIKEDNKSNGLLEAINKVVDNSYADLENYAVKMEPTLFKFYKYNSITVAELKEKKPDELNVLLESFKNENDYIYKLKEKLMIGVFEFDCSNL